MAILVSGVVGADGTNEKEEHEDGGTNNNQATLGRLVVAVLSPGTGRTRGVLAHLVTAKLVPDKTCQRDGVTKVLLARDGVIKEHDRGNNQQDILEDTAQGHDERRSLANLQNGLAVHSVYISIIRI